MMSIKAILKHLKGVREGADGQFQARCPAHNDNNPSLSISEADDGKILVHCHAGCTVEAIVEAIGFTVRDLFPNAGFGLGQYARLTRLPLDFLKSLGLTEITRNRVRVVRIPYLNPKGEVSAVRFRIAASGDRFRWKRGDRPTPYGLWRLENYDTTQVTLVEGESDAQVLWHHEIPAVAVPGATTWKADWARHLEVFTRINLVVEPDCGGRALLERLRGSTLANKLHLIDLTDHLKKENDDD